MALVCDHGAKPIPYNVVEWIVRQFLRGAWIRAWPCHDYDVGCFFGRIRPRPRNYPFNPSICPVISNPHIAVQDNTRSNLDLPNVPVVADWLLRFDWVRVHMHVPAD